MRRIVSVDYIAGLARNLSADPRAHDQITESIRTREKIESFSALPTGWYYGSGKAPDRAAIDNAHNWHATLIRRGFPLTDAFPGQSGEIMISGYSGGDVAELILEADNTYSLYLEKDGQETLSLPRRDAQEIMRSLCVIEAIEAGDKWNMSGFSITSISTKGGTDSSASLSRIQGEVYHSYSSNVYKAEQNQSAATSGGTTKMPPESLQYSGFLTNSSYPLVQTFNSGLPLPEMSATTKCTA
ncbi:MAG TPA: hypothetical protein VHU23_11365 [Rhizomicrobium sp.]|jgi:hypothetical protein|nr:hypothetical protein [Rhizomicrobium sp.]